LIFQKAFAEGPGAIPGLFCILEAQKSK